MPVKEEHAITATGTVDDNALLGANLRTRIKTHSALVTVDPAVADKLTAIRKWMKDPITGQQVRSKHQFHSFFLFPNSPIS